MLGYGFCAEWLNQPHVLIAGSTGSGKSVLLDDILYTMTAFRFSKKAILIDLKRVGFRKWRNFPQVHEVITEPEQVIPCLDNIIHLMDFRYKLMEKQNEEMSSEGDLYIVIDELAEVLSIKGVSERLDKLLRLARAARIHLIMATQNPARTGKGAIPANVQQNVTIAVGLHCRTAIESKQIIGIPGCEKLPQYGYCIVRNNSGYELQEIPVTTKEMINNRLIESFIKQCVE